MTQNSIANGMGQMYPSSNMVINHQSIFLPIKFGLDWVEDTQMRDLMLNYYLTQDMAYPDESLMVLKIQNKANLISEYWNKMYKLRSIEYQPLENYDRYEDIQETGLSKGKSSNSGTSLYSEFPMESPLKKSVNNTDSNSSANSEANTDTTRKAHIHGNIGVTTSQQMLESEINLQKQLSMLKQLYIKEYEDLFFINL